MRRIIVGVSGASGSIYGYTLLRVLRERGDVEVHLVVSRAAKRTIQLEMDEIRAGDFEALADVVHRDEDLAASISSGSFYTDGMAIVPCSIKTAAAVAYSLNENLLVRAADVCLKERRPLVMVVRETPLHLGHLRTLTHLAETGAIILPPIPGMYTKPKSVQEIVDHTVGKVLDQLGLRNELFNRWKGPDPAPP